MTSMTLLLLLALASGAYAQVPEATPKCAERGGCRDSAPPSSGGHVRDNNGPSAPHGPSPHTKAVRLWNDSIDQLHAGNYAQAEAEIVQVLNAYPNVGEARYNYAWLLMKRGRCDSAIGQATLAVKYHDNSFGKAGSANPTSAQQLITYCQGQLNPVTLAPSTAPRRTYIGASFAVQGEVYQVTMDGQRTAITGAGERLNLYDHISTGANSRLQIVLADNSVFTLGANSDMVLDEFVYDPDASVRKVSARITKGVFRFVTGKVARTHVENFKVKGNTDSLGIRGTDVEIDLTDEGTILTGVGGVDGRPLTELGTLVLRSGQVTYTHTFDDGKWTQWNLDASDEFFWVLTKEGVLVKKPQEAKIPDFGRKVID